jgi:flagellar motor switch protein FliM
VIELVLADARQAFAPLSDIAFELDRVGTDARSAASARPCSAAMAARFRIDMDGRVGRLELLLPHTALDLLRRNLLQQSGGKQGCDTIWEGRLASELWAARLEVRAVLAECKQPLGKMLDLKVGDTLMLDAAPGAPVKLKCAAVDLTAGHVGRIGPSLAVRVERPITPAAQHAVMKLEGRSSGR